MMRSEPFLVLILQVMAYSSGATAAKWANGFESCASTSRSAAGTGANSTPE